MSDKLSAEKMDKITMAAELEELRAQLAEYEKYSHEPIGYGWQCGESIMFFPAYAKEQAELYGRNGRKVFPVYRVSNAAALANGGKGK